MMSARLGVEQLESRDCPATLQGYATALVQQVRSDAVRLAVDVALVERLTPTAAGATLNRDAAALYKAAQSGSVGDILAAESQLCKDAVSEAVLVQNLHLNANVLLTSKAFQTDVATVVGDASLVNDLVTFLAQHQKVQTTQTAYQLQQQIAQSNARAASLTTTNNLASYNWGGNTSLAARATAGIAPVGFNSQLAAAGLAGWKIPGINI